MQMISLEQLRDFRVGQAEDAAAGTGCTVIICPEGAVAGVDVRGGGPASRETELLRSDMLVEKIQAVMLAGGSAYGLEAAAGAMKFLEARGIGFETGFGVVPIVCSSCLFDLWTGDGSVRPDQAMGYAACEAAFSQVRPLCGCYGAGTGATVGKYLGKDYAMKSGIGIQALQAGTVQLAAIVAVNALGDVYDPDSHTMLAGLLGEDKKSLRSTEDLMLTDLTDPKILFASNTTIGCIITNARLSKPQANRLATLAHNGLARTIKPVHTAFDGDSIFVMASGRAEVFSDALSVLAVRAIMGAVRTAVLSADCRYGLPASRDIINQG